MMVKTLMATTAIMMDGDDGDDEHEGDKGGDDDDASGDDGGDDGVDDDGGHGCDVFSLGGDYGDDDGGTGQDRHPLSGRSPARRGARVVGTAVPQYTMYSSQKPLPDGPMHPRLQREPPIRAAPCQTQNRDHAEMK